MGGLKLIQMHSIRENASVSLELKFTANCRMRCAFPKANVLI
jgi:hypothetical protein